VLGPIAKAGAVVVVYLFLAAEGVLATSWTADGGGTYQEQHPEMEINSNGQCRFLNGRKLQETTGKLN
jgi:hypothetical protein